jgi:Na+-transporting NADH:ubiquinone oxidoreductase subunit NqrE
MSRFQLPILEPVTKGVLLALFSVVVASIGAAFFLGALAPASPALLESLATIGAVFLAGYVVEVVWMVPRMGRGEEFEEWLGFAVGAGIAGLLAIAVALLVAQHRAAGNANAIDDLGLSFVVVSLLILGGTLVLQPLLARRFDDGEGDVQVTPPAATDRFE